MVVRINIKSRVLHMRAYVGVVYVFLRKIPTWDDPDLSGFLYGGFYTQQMYLSNI